MAVPLLPMGKSCKLMCLMLNQLVCVNSLDIHDGFVIVSYLMNESVNVNNIKSILKYDAVNDNAIIAYISNVVH